MNLYSRDYSKPENPEEKAALEQEIEFEEKKGIKNPSESPRFSHPNPEVRNFLWHNRSLFPNNHLNPFELEDADPKKITSEYIAVLDEAKNESAIQEYIYKGRKWYIPGALFKDYNFGHHSAYLFPEQKLGGEYKADYMLLGENSDGYHIVLAELENVNVDYLQQYQLGETKSVRKGLNQIRTWKLWLDDNREYFLRSTGLKEKNIDVPTSRIHYALIVGRRSRMTDKAKEIRSQTAFEIPNLKILTYDRLADNLMQLDCGFTMNY